MSLRQRATTVTFSLPQSSFQIVRLQKEPSTTSIKGLAWWPLWSKLLAQLPGHRYKLHREIVLLALAPVFLELGLRGFFARFLDHRRDLKTHRHRARRTLRVLLVKR